MDILSVKKVFFQDRMDDTLNALHEDCAEGTHSEAVRGMNLGLNWGSGVGSDLGSEIFQGW